MKNYIIFLAVLISLAGMASALDNPVMIAANETFEIPAGETLTVHEGETLDIYGLLINNGNMFVDGIVIIHEWLPSPGMVVDDYGPAQQETCLKNYGQLTMDNELYNYHYLENYGTVHVVGYLHNNGLMYNYGNVNNDGQFWNDATLYNYGMVETIFGRMYQAGMTVDLGGEIITSGSYYIEEVDENGNPKPVPEVVEDNVTGHVEIPDLELDGLVEVPVENNTTVVENVTQDEVESVTPPAVVTPVVKEVKEEKTTEKPVVVKKNTTVVENVTQDEVENVTPPAVVTPVVKEVKEEKTTEKPVVVKKNVAPSQVEKKKVKADTPTQAKDTRVKEENTPVKDKVVKKNTAPVQVKENVTRNTGPAVVWGNETNFEEEPVKVSISSRIWQFLQRLFAGDIAWDVA